jgi:hypothetical protein
LLGFGAERLEIPALLSDTRNHLRSREIQLGRGLSPAEALKNPRIQLDMAHRIVLEQWLAEPPIKTRPKDEDVLPNQVRFRVF